MSEAPGVIDTDTARTLISAARERGAKPGLQQSLTIEPAPDYLVIREPDGRVRFYSLGVGGVADLVTGPSPGVSL